MRRLFYKGKLENYITITGEDAHHLKNVNRAKIGEEITVVDDFNAAARMKVFEYGENTAILKLVEKIPLVGEAKTKITLAFSVLKGEKTDLILQKATELGAYKIVPIITERVVVKLDDKKKAEKIKRWEKITTEAAKQSGGLPPKISPITDLNDFLRENKNPLIFFYENEEEKSLKEALSNIKGDNLGLLIGPEGGFSAKEAENIINAGAFVATLGKRILRAETAAITAVALAMYERGELK